MTDSLSLHNIYVEGDDDINILSRWFPRLQFVKAGGKDEVRRKVRQERTSYGLLDRDFASDDQVAASRAPDSHLIILARYCIENYLLESTIVFTAISQLQSLPEQDWLGEAYVHHRLEEWASELTLYAAANSIISEWRDRIQSDKELDFLHYFGPLPPIPRVEVVESLRRRLAALTPADQIETLLDARHAQVSADIVEWNGLQRWVNGKVLLESYLYPNVFEPAGLSKSRARDLLIEAGRHHIPAELQELAQRWTA